MSQSVPEGVAIRFHSAVSPGRKWAKAVFAGLVAVVAPVVLAALFWGAALAIDFHPKIGAGLWLTVAAEEMTLIGCALAWEVRRASRSVADARIFFYCFTWPSMLVAVLWLLSFADWIIGGSTASGG